jgi:hypothetical protein
MNKDIYSRLTSRKWRKQKEGEGDCTPAPPKPLKGLSKASQDFHVFVGVGPEPQSEAKTKRSQEERKLALRFESESFTSSKSPLSKLSTAPGTPITLYELTADELLEGFRVKVDGWEVTLAEVPGDGEPNESSRTSYWMPKRMLSPYHLDLVPPTPSPELTSNLS